MEVKHIESSKDFEELVLKSNKTVLVDFFATWCGPCRMMSPIIEEVAEEVAGKYDVFKLDVDVAEDVARRYAIMSVPTLMVFDKGIEISKMIGLNNKDNIVSALENV